MVVEGGSHNEKWLNAYGKGWSLTAPACHGNRKAIETAAAVVAGHVGTSSAVAGGCARGKINVMQFSAAATVDVPAAASRKRRRESKCN